MQEQAYIYKILNKVNNRYYIGSTVDFKRRCSEHKGQLHKNVHINKDLQKDYNEYGLDVFEFTIIKEVNVSDRELVEENILRDCLTDPLCYNENKNNRLPYRKLKTYLYDVATYRVKYTFNSYEDASKELKISVGNVSDAIWYSKTVVYKGITYLIGTTEGRYMTLDEKIEKQKSDILCIDISTLSIVNKIKNKEFIKNSTLEEKILLFTKYRRDTKNNKLLYYFEDEKLPTKAMLNDRSSYIGKYTAYGTFIEKLSKEKLQEVLQENTEKVLGVARKNSRALLSEGKANFNKTFDGFIYVFGETFKEKIKVHLVQITNNENPNEVYYFSNNKDCGDFLGVTKSSICYAIKHNGNSAGYKIRNVISDDYEITENMYVKK